MEDWRDERFTDRGSLEKRMEEKFSKYITGMSAVQFGFMLPGHGNNGKQVAIASDVELEEMHKTYEGKKRIKMYLKLNSKPQSSGLDPPQAKRVRTESQALEKMDELQQAVTKLKEKHKDGPFSKFTHAQFHCWANSIQLGTHVPIGQWKDTCPISSVLLKRQYQHHKETFC